MVLAADDSSGCAEAVQGNLGICMVLAAVKAVVQGGPLFLPPPNFPMFQNGVKQLSPELATPSSDRVQNFTP